MVPLTIMVLALPPVTVLSTCPERVKALPVLPGGLVVVALAELVEEHVENTLKTVVLVTPTIFVRGTVYKKRR